jgi:hypothetical protein
MSLFSVHDVHTGMHVRATMDLFEYLAGDNSNYDVAVLEGETAGLVNSQFDINKMLRLAS